MTKKLVLVETLSQFRIRYAIMVEDDINHALDTVVCQDEGLAELSQEYLGELPISHREITMDEYMKIFNEDNDYLNSWSDDKKKEFIYEVKYGNQDLQQGELPLVREG